jgi:hypothetical protein
VVLKASGADILVCRVSKQTSLLRTAMPLVYRCANQPTYSRQIPRISHLTGPVPPSVLDVLLGNVMGPQPASALVGDFLSSRWVEFGYAARVLSFDLRRGCRWIRRCPASLRLLGWRHRPGRVRVCHNCRRTDCAKRNLRTPLVPEGVAAQPITACAARNLSTWSRLPQRRLWFAATHSHPAALPARREVQVEPG